MVLTRQSMSRRVLLAFTSALSGDRISHTRINRVRKDKELFACILLDLATLAARRDNLMVAPVCRALPSLALRAPNP